MARTKLASAEGERKSFKGTFSKFGKKVSYKGYSEETVLLINIIDVENNEVVTDHAWFSLTKGFEKINPKEGDVLIFEARIKEYKKGYVNKRAGINNQRKDFRLSHPTKISLVKPQG
jgi:hypothetical protein